MDWGNIFGTTWSEIAEVVIRGSIMYLAIFVLVRVMRREAGGLSTPDLIVIVVVADAAQNGLAGQYRTVPTGIVLVAVIVAWSVLLDILAYRFPRFGRLVEPSPVVLVKNGLILHPNLRKNLITKDELMTAMHDQGLEQLGEVKSAYLEGDGSITVVPIAAPTA
ncbi:MAG: YetF domain-containing protein [Tepidiformaceae bacterium]